MITIVYGPQACGKTRNKNALAAHFGHSTVIDGAYPFKRKAKFTDDQGITHQKLPFDSLILTNMSYDECVVFAALSDHKVTILSFADAMIRVSQP